MIEDDKNKGSKSGDKLSDEANKLIEKGKDFADKAEDFFGEKVQQVKESDAFSKISGLIGKVESFLDDKSEEFQSGEMGSKFEAFRTKVEDRTDELLNKVKEAGIKIGDQVEESLDSIIGKKDQTKNQNGEGI